MSTTRIYIIIVFCLLSLGLMTACDRTIHEYPKDMGSLVIIEPNVDRDPPLYYKEVVYDAAWNREVAELPAVPARPYSLDDNVKLRLVVDIYNGTLGEDVRGDRLERRMLYVEKDAQAPQETIQVHLPAGGDYYALASADYVYEDDLSSWHYYGDKLTNVYADLQTYPANTDLRSTAAGQVEFAMGKDGYPSVKAKGTAKTQSRVVPVMMSRPSGRYKLIALDYGDFVKSGGTLDGMTIKVIYKQYVSVGYNVASQEPNMFTTTYSFNTNPASLVSDGDEITLLGDYLFTSHAREDNVVIDLYFYDTDGTELNHCQGIEIPLMSNCETIVKGLFLTRELGEGDDIAIDENFEGENTIQW